MECRAANAVPLEDDNTVWMWKFNCGTKLSSLAGWNLRSVGRSAGNPCNAPLLGIAWTWKKAGPGHLSSDCIALLDRTSMCLEPKADLAWPENKGEDRAPDPTASRKNTHTQQITLEQGALC